MHSRGKKKCENEMQPVCVSSRRGLFLHKLKSLGGDCGDVCKIFRSIKYKTGLEYYLVYNLASGSLHTLPKHTEPQFACFCNKRPDLQQSELAGADAATSSVIPITHFNHHL